MKLYMIRHGESVNNKEKRYSGWAQTPLSEKGREDALRLLPVLKDIPFDQVYCSDLLRARQTQELALPGVTPQISPLLREQNVGILQDHHFQECLERYGSLMERSRASRDFRDFQGECLNDHKARVQAFLDLLPDCERIAVFCHEGTICNMLSLVTNSGYEQWSSLCDNGSIAVFEKLPGRWVLRQWNYTGELWL